MQMKVMVICGFFLLSRSRKYVDLQVPETDEEDTDLVGPKNEQGALPLLSLQCFIAQKGSNTTLFHTKVKNVHLIFRQLRI